MQMQMGQELLQASIVVQALGLGLHGVGSELARLSDDRAKIGRMLAIRDLLLPVIVMSVLSILRAPQPAIIGAALFAISPGALLLPQAALARPSQSNLLFGTSVVSAMSSIVTVPFWLPIMCWLFVSDASVAPAAVAQLAGVLFLLPLALGTALRRLEPGLMKIASRPVIIAADALLWLALLPLVGDAFAGLPQLGFPFVVAVVCAPSATVLVAVLTRRAGSLERSGLAHLCSSRHPALALLVAESNFAGEGVLSAIVVTFIGALAAAMLYTFLTRYSRAEPPAAIVAAIAIARDDPAASRASRPR
jgi:BASS family bile acid:Na+ symporter